MIVPGHIEPLAAVLRVPGAYGEPYTWAATLRYDSPTSVEILGVTRAPTPSEWRAAVRTMRAYGIHKFRFTRRHSNSAVEHDWTTRKEGT